VITGGWQPQAVFCSVLLALQDGYKVTEGENDSPNDTDTEWRLGCLAFILLSCNSWAQVKSWCCSAKAAFKYVI
jgi:hypothetical protein